MPHASRVGRLWWQVVAGCVRIGVGISETVQRVIVARSRAAFERAIAALCSKGSITQDQADHALAVVTSFDVALAGAA